MKANYTFFLVSILVISLSSIQCSQPKQETPHLVDRESFFRGELVYTQNCKGCHKANGKGFKNLYPPLAKSDFLLTYPEKSIHYIYNGTSDSIQVNGKSYNFQMPDNKHLTRQEIADVMTYIGNNWGNKAPSYDVKKINDILTR